MRKIMIRWITALIVCIAAASAGAEEVTYLKAGKLFDSRSGKVTNNAVVTIVGERIVDVGGSSTAIPDGANVIDLSDSFVLPGLMDMHTHVVSNLDGNFFSHYFQSPHRRTIGGVVNVEKTLLAGFTTIRNVGASDYADVALRNAINAGEIIAMYKAPAGEEGQIKAMIAGIGEKRASLEQKRRDIEETLREMDLAEENCFERLAELGVSQ